MKKILSIFLLIALALGGTVKAEELTVSEGTTTNNYVPYEGNYADTKGARSQVIYPASLFTDMDGATITQLKFYTSTATASYGTAVHKVSLKAVNQTELTYENYKRYFCTVEAADVVYEGALSVADNALIINLATPYVYEDGTNLLLDIEVTTKGSWVATSFYGVSQSAYNAGYTRTDGATTCSDGVKFIPKTTFTYSPATGGCPKPKSLKTTILPDGATFEWSQNADETTYQYAIVAKDADVESWTTLEANVRTVTIHSLTAGTAYDFYVRSYCGAGEGEQSASVKSSFSPACEAPTFPTNPVSELSAFTATITWNAVAGISKYQYLCVAKDADTTGLWASVEAKEVLSAELTSLTAKTNYDFYVRSYFNATSISDAVKTTFRTDADCSTIVVDADHIWVEDFSGFAAGNESSDAPDCWALLNANAGSRPYIYISATGTTWFSLDNNALYFSNTNSKYGYAILPVFATALNTLQIAFDQKVEGSNSGAIELGYMTNITDESTFSLLHSCDKSTTWKSENVMLNAVPSGARLAFRYKATSSSYYDAAVDNITISLAPACVKPSEVKATSLDSVSANITWTNGGEEASWKLQYSTDNTNWTAANEGNAFTTKPYELTGLKASTTYYVQVKAVCGVSDESDWSVAGSFTTDCNAADELNEAFSSSLPDCWKVSKTGGDYSWTPSSSYKVSASYSMDYYATAAASEYSDLITPNVNLGDKESNLTFYLKNDGWSGAVTAEVYIVVGSTTTKLVDLAATSGWELQTIDLSAYVGKTAKFIFRAHGAGSYSHIYIDDVAISVKPCNKPTGLAAAASKGSATITWTDEEADEWNLQYRIVAEPENVWTEVKGLTAKSHTLESLDEEAEYEVQVQAVCSATRSSDWTASVKFKPVCPTPGAITLTDKTYNSATASWTAGGAETAWNVQIKEGEGEYGASIPVTEPTYELAGLTTGTQYTVRVQASCGGDWSAEATYTPAYTEPEVAAATSITETSATVAWGAVADAAGYEVALTLRGVAASEWKATTKTDTTFSNLAAKTDYDVFVRAKYDTGESTADSIGFSTIAVAPTDLVQGTTTTESISFSWSYAGAATQFQYKVNDGDWSAPQTALTATVNGLNSGTTYTIYVRAYYADGKESSELSESFATECAVKALGWSEDFEASSSIPACWEGGSDVSIAASSGVSNSNALRLRAYSTVQAATPEINISEAAVLNFSYQSSSATGAVYINSVAEENKVATLSTTNNFKEVSVDLAAYNGQDIKVIFYGNSTGYNRYIYIDNVEVTAKPCPAISNLTATAALDSVVLAWESDAEAFEYCVVEGSAEAAGWQATAAKTVTVKGLTPETAYTAYVRSSCSETKKGEATGKAFTPACPAPDAAEASAVTTTTAKLSWTAAAGITHYQYKLNDEDWVAEHVVEGASVELSALTPGTAYKFYVRSYYSAAVQSTATSVDFTTECAAQALPFNEDFEGAITCWTLVDCHSDSKVSGGVFQFYFSSNPPQYLISPELVPSEKNVKVQFEYKAKNSTWEESFQVGYSTTTKETTAFTWSDTIFCNVTDYQEYSDVLPAGVRFIAIKYTANDKDHLYIDNFSATETSEATAIDNIGAGIKSDAIKVMKNGVLYIIRDGIQYNAQGARVIEN